MDWGFCLIFFFFLEQSTKQTSGFFPTLKLEWYFQFISTRIGIVLREFYEPTIWGHFPDFSPTIKHGSVGIEGVDWRLFSLSSTCRSNCDVKFPVRPYQDRTGLIISLFRFLRSDYFKWTGLGQKSCHIKSFILLLNLFYLFFMNINFILSVLWRCD